MVYGREVVNDGFGARRTFASKHASDCMTAKQCRKACLRAQTWRGPTIFRTYSAYKSPSCSGVSAPLTENHCDTEVQSDMMATRKCGALRNWNSPRTRPSSRQS